MTLESHFGYREVQCVTYLNAEDAEHPVPVAICPCSAGVEFQ